jgi:KipI family sensor histidine kinase inhibitor
MTDFRIVAAGDAAWLVEWPARIDPAVSARTVALAVAIKHAHGDTIRDVVVGYCSVTVYFDPLRVDGEQLAVDLRQCARDVDGARVPEGKLVNVEVCYGDEFGPDLPEVAAHAGITESEVIALHTAPTYRVYVVGFVPGFPYMASVDARLVLPRRTEPRTRVPAGSVAIAAGQTGIYPTETPGGWHLIGRTHVKPYDADRAQPFLFNPGDRVRFHPVDRAEFERTA